MPETSQPESIMDPYIPGKFTRFLWWLATAEKELISDCVVDRNRYAITGMIVLGTWSFATLAWTYFFSTVTTGVVVPVLLGIFMGLIILGIDRALIKGIRGYREKKLLPVLFRGLLALTIGTFMAQPAMIFLFDREIHEQIALDNTGKMALYSRQQDRLYANQTTALVQQKNFLQEQLASKYREVATARNNFIAEADGTGGSKKIGLKSIALAKEAEYGKLGSDYALLEQELRPRITGLDTALGKITTEKQQAADRYRALLNDGFLTRVEALHNLLANNPAARFRYYLLITLIVLIELMPVIAKYLLPEGVYDHRVMLREELENNLAVMGFKNEQALRELYNQLAFQEDSAFIKTFFESSKKAREEKLSKRLQQWGEQPQQSLRRVWQELKADYLSGQEY